MQHPPPSAEVLTAVGGFEDEFTRHVRGSGLPREGVPVASPASSAARGLARLTEGTKDQAPRWTVRGDDYDPERTPTPADATYLSVVGAVSARADGADRRAADVCLRARWVVTTGTGHRTRAAPSGCERSGPAGRCLGCPRGVRPSGPVELLGPGRMQYTWFPVSPTSPLSRQFGFDRGLPIDRYYIEQFLAEHGHLIAGRVLEVGDSAYTRRLGGERVSQADVLTSTAAAPETTIVADLAEAPTTFRLRAASTAWSSPRRCTCSTTSAAAVQTLHRILRPGGTVLATFPGISPLSSDRWAESWYWALTPLAAAPAVRGRLRGRGTWRCGPSATCCPAWRSWRGWRRTSSVRGGARVQVTPSSRCW